jgi:WD40 repeat protein
VSGKTSLELWDRAALPLRLKASIPLSLEGRSMAAILHRGNRLLVLASDADKKESIQVLQWDLTGAKPEKLKSFSATCRIGPPVMPAFTNGGKTMILPGEGGVLRRWDLATGKPEQPLPIVGYSEWVFCVRFMPDGYRLLSGSSDKTVRLWEPVKGQFVEKALLQHGGEVFDLAIAPRTGLLASTGFFPTKLRLWDGKAQPPKEREELALSDTHAWVSVVSPDETTLYTCTGLETRDERFKKDEKSADAIHVWDVSGAKAKEKVVVHGHEGAVMGLAVSPDGKLLAAGGGRMIYKKDGKSEDITDLRLWDVTGPEPEEVARLKGHTKIVYSVAFSPDGKLLASAGRDHTVRLWDLSGKKPKELAVLKRHRQPTCSVTFSPDGKTLASCDFHGRIVLWDVGSNDMQREFNLPGRVGRVAFAPDGRHRASANANGTVYVFRLGPPPK